MLRLVMASAFVGLMVGGGVAQAAAAEPPGKTIFLREKCNECHTVASHKIAVEGKPEDKPHELAGIGAKRSET